MTSTIIAPVSGPIAIAPETRRVLSVDALRGFDMFWILGADALVHAFKRMSGNGEGAMPSVARFLSGQLEHVDWQGFVFYDLIFPLFVFIVGVSLVFSLTKTVEREGKAAAHKRVLVRAAVRVRPHLFRRRHQ
jgi:predicted acyltransferase